MKKIKDNDEYFVVTLENMSKEDARSYSRCYGLRAKPARTGGYQLAGDEDSVREMLEDYIGRYDKIGKIMNEGYYVSADSFRDSKVKDSIFNKEEIKKDIKRRFTKEDLDNYSDRTLTFAILMGMRPEDCEGMDVESEFTEEQLDEYDEINSIVYEVQRELAESLKGKDRAFKDKKVKDSDGTLDDDDYERLLFRAYKGRELGELYENGPHQLFEEAYSELGYKNDGVWFIAPEVLKDDDKMKALYNNVRSKLLEEYKSGNLWDNNLREMFDITYSLKDSKKSKKDAKVKDSYEGNLEALEEFLEWEGIIGYDYYIKDIYETNEAKIDDKWETFDNPYDALDAYLKWEGVLGYTDAIYDILENGVESTYYDNMLREKQSYEEE